MPKPIADDPHRFEFDLDRGIRLQTVDQLEKSPILPLTKGVGPDASGIYALYFRGGLVYIGKASKGTTKPDMHNATTCHCERTNLSVRLFTRRFTRCTLGYSKKAENLKHAVALFVAHFNFCRVHSAHGITPAQSAGITKHAWTLDEILSFDCQAQSSPT